MPNVTMTLTREQAAQLRHHLCVAFNHWTEQARHSNGPDDKKVCENIANTAIDLFALCLVADDNIKVNEVEKALI